VELALDNNPEDKTSYSIQYQDACLKYLEKRKYCAKHGRVPVAMDENTPNIDFSSSAIASRSGQSSYVPYDLCSDDDEYLIPTSVAETTPTRSDRTSRLSTDAWLYLN
jgi:hypothetical protein